MGDDMSDGLASLISAVIPPEPPNGSVVLDAKGSAWQSVRTLSLVDQRPVWVSGRELTLHSDLAQRAHVKPWAHLVVDQGPLTILHYAPEAKS